MPATDTIDFEREFADVVRELRAVPAAAPAGVRERVRALGEPAPKRQALSLSGRAEHGAAGTVTNPAQKHVFGTAVGVPTPLQSPLVPPATGRHQNYDAWMRLRVKDLDTLTQRTNEAMQVVRSYGGYVASVNQSTTAGAPGEADLILRVPVAHVEDALIRLASLGTVLDRRLSIVDLEQTLRQQRQHILRLRVFIARATEQLKQPLPADVRLRLQLQLQQAQADLSQ